MALIAIVGFFITIFFAGVRLRKLENERQAAMAAEREVLNRKYRLSLITRDEFREKLIKSGNNNGHSGRGARQYADETLHIYDLDREANPTITRRLYEYDQLVGCFLRGEIPKHDMVSKLIEHYKKFGVPHEQATANAVQAWELMEPIWTHKSYIYIPLPPPTA